MNGTTATVAIEISDSGCRYEDLHIMFWKIGPDRNLVKGERIHHYPFADECAISKNSFTCNKDGHTPLSGTTFKKTTKGDVPRGRTPQYRCISGCDNASVPTVLFVHPYE
jgi:hypothetical protein